MAAPNTLASPSTTSPHVDSLASAIAAVMDQSPAPMDHETWWPTWDKEYACETMDSSLYRKNGCLLQFLNNNAQGMAGVIGGIRIAQTDIRKMPQYIAKNKGYIKNYAIKLLQKHLIETQCPVGAGESLSQEDYGVSFSVASLSPKALLLHPTRRQEGPLFFCLYDGLMEPIVLSRNNDNQVIDSAYMINVYLNLLPITQRRTAVLKKITEDEKAETLPSTAPPQKKSKTTQTMAVSNQMYQGSYPNNIPAQANQGPNGSYQGPNGNYQENNYRGGNYQGGNYQGGYQGRRPMYNQPIPAPANEELVKQVVDLNNTMEARFKKLEANQVPLPPLPQPSAPIWPVVNITLPDE